MASYLCCLVLLGALRAFVDADAGVGRSICTTETNTFTVVVDLFASELGYYSFEECPGMLNPTLEMEIGQSYTFIQSDISNWMHPMGFAYFPDGAHDDKDELEPTISQTGSACVQDFSCPTPRYFRGSDFLGVNGTEDFGLDVYEPEFFDAIPDWSARDTYSIELTFDDASYTKDIFYFCHIHQYMSGRIKLLSGGVPVSEADEPELGYEYDMPGEFDTKCGSFGLDSFQLPNQFCPPRFVCGSDEGDQALQDFAACIEAQNCAMLAGMTTGITAQSETALFIHQMIPHHQNAVNMAKTLLKAEILNCPDATNEENEDCTMEIILREIVNTQNHQIQSMRAYLEAKGYPDTDDCEVILQKEDVPDIVAEDPTSSASSVRFFGSFG